MCPSLNARLGLPTHIAKDPNPDHLATEDAHPVYSTAST
jgi:hypothetical protein